MSFSAWHIKQKWLKMFVKTSMFNVSWLVWTVKNLKVHFPLRTLLDVLWKWYCILSTTSKFIYFSLVISFLSHDILKYVILQVESIVLSIISMLSSPNDESPANVEAAVSFIICYTATYLSFLLICILEKTMQAWLLLDAAELSLT